VGQALYQTKALVRSYNMTLSNFAFSFNLRRYVKEFVTGYKEGVKTAAVSYAAMVGQCTLTLSNPC
jgi:hypothetical protein